MTHLQTPVRLRVAIVQVRDYVHNSNVCTHTDLITTVLQGCLKTPHIDLVVFSGTGDVSSIRGNGKGQEFVIVQEWAPNLLTRLEVPNTNRAIRRCTDKMTFIAGQTDGVDWVGMTAKNKELFAIN